MYTSRALTIINPNSKTPRAVMSVFTADSKRNRTTRYTVTPASARRWQSLWKATPDGLFNKFYGNQPNGEYHERIQIVSN
jgi:hypothetical protein